MSKEFILKQVVFVRVQSGRQKLQQQTSSYEKLVTQVVGGTKSKRRHSEVTEAVSAGNSHHSYGGWGGATLGLSASRSQYLTCNT